MREYLLAMCIAGAVTYLATPLVRMVAIRWGAMAMVRDRDVHAIPMPRLGGVAMYIGICAALMIAHLMPILRRSFDNSDSTAILIAGGLICALGAADDRWELDSLTKLTGQVLTVGVMVILGVQLALIYIPFGGIGTIVLGQDQSVGLTVLFCVVTVNAINFIDGLDGLAAGVSAISALAFFMYSYHLSRVGYTADIAFTPTLMSAVLAGACLGFLPHNFSPARIFMGDSGSMLIGLMLAASATTATSADSQGFHDLFGALGLFLGLLIPVGVLAIPLVDLTLAVFRRVRAGRSPFAPDKMHLHHRLLEIGHSQRRAVLIIYFWAALLAFGGVAVSVTRSLGLVVFMLGGLAVAALILMNLPRLRAGGRAP